MYRLRPALSALLVVLLASAAMLPPPASAQEPLPGEFRPLPLYGGRATAVVGEPAFNGRLYAAVQGAGVFVSDDGGAAWTASSTGLPIDPVTGGTVAVMNLARDSAGRVYALTAIGPYASDDRGRTWFALPDPVGPRGPLVQALPDPADPSRIVASNGRLGRGVYVSTDRGLTWSPSNQGLEETTLIDLERAGGSSITLYAATRNAVYRSGDAGATWERRSDLPAPDPRDLAVDPWDHDLIYLATATGTYRSRDRGLTWASLTSSIPDADIHRLVVGNRLLAVGRGGLYHGHRLGKLTAGPDFLHTRATGAVVLQGGELVLATEMGLLRGSSAVFTGEEVPAMSNRGILAADINSVSAARGSSVLYAATGQGYDAGLFRSPDNGETWEHRSLGLTNPDLRSLAVAPTDPDVVYVGTVDAREDFGENGGIFRTTDGGMTWTDVGANLPHDDARIIISLAVDHRDANTVYAGVQAYNGGIFRTTDGGETWQRMSNGLQAMPEMPGFEDNPFIDYFVMLSIAQDAAHPDRIYLGAGGCWGGVYVTENSGLSWSRRDANAMEVDSEVPMPPMFGVHLELFDIDIDPSNPDRILTSGGRGAFPGGEIDGNDQVGVVFESTDAGATWSLVRRISKSDYFDSPVTGLCIDPLAGERLYLSTRDGILVSEDGGAAGSWFTANEGLGSRETFTRGLFMDSDDPSRLYLATAVSGLWVRQVNPVPVTLTGFSAQAVGGDVELRWGVADAHDHAGFHVDRRLGARVDRLTERLLTGRDEYVFVDGDAPAGRAVRYDLVEVDRLGAETRVGSLEVTVPFRPGVALGAARPNPSRGETRLRLILEQPGAVRARVFDAAGRLVTVLRDEVMAAGTTDLHWDAAAAGAAPGIYFVRVDAGGASASTKLLVLP